ncbi:hypothetical protein [Candidatus Nitrosocosmicus sp. R]
MHLVTSNPPVIKSNFFDKRVVREYSNFNGFQLINIVFLNMPLEIVENRDFKIIFEMGVVTNMA